MKTKLTALALVTITLCVPGLALASSQAIAQTATQNGRGFEHSHAERIFARMGLNERGFADSVTGFRYLALQPGPQAHSSASGPTVDGGRPLGSD